MEKRREELIALSKKKMEIIEDEKKIFQDYIHIDNGKYISDDISIDKIPKFKDEDNYNYNLKQKYITLIDGLSITNENIINSFKVWKKIHNNDVEVSVFSTYHCLKLLKLNEYIIYDIKKFIDESIATLWVIRQEENIDNIKIDSIGSMLNDKNSDIVKEKIPDLLEFKDFFEIINDICNSYKHSFTNNMRAMYGSEEDCVISIYAKGNKDIYNSKVYSVPLRRIINEFNLFYKKFFELVENS